MPSSYLASSPGFVAGPGAVDCHIHIVGPQDRYPFAASRSYAAPPATVQDYVSVAKVLGIDHAVVIQPSFYGTDNSCLLDTLQATDGNWRGVAVVDAGTSDAELEKLHAAGVRGTRLNLVSSPEFARRDHRELVPEAAALAKELGWHVQIFGRPEVLSDLADMQEKLDVPLVIDHFGFADPALAMSNPLTGPLLALKRICGAGGWVKLSGLYRVADDPDSPDLVRFAKALFDAAPDQLVWGSDWPHTASHGNSGSGAGEVRPYRGLDTGALLKPLANWLPNADDRQRVLVANPARLYDFPMQ